MRYFILCCLCSLATICYADEPSAHYRLRKEIINIDTLNKSILSLISYSGTTSREEALSIYHSEMEIVKDLEASYLNAGYKMTRLKSKSFVHTKLFTRTFYTGSKGISFIIPYEQKNKGPQPFSYSYAQSCPEMMYFAGFSFDAQEEPDSFHYEISIPYGYQLIIHKKDLLALKDLQIDSTGNQHQMRYTLSYRVPAGKKSEESGSSYLQAAAPPAFVRAIIVPLAYKDQPDLYFNKWYEDLVRKSNDLSVKDYQVLADSLTKGMTDTSEMISAVFRYTRKKIRYLDIENGIHAFKPRDINATIHNKQGDCKDMANLMSMMLQYKGIDARIAISSTLTHPFDLDFPSLASANHAICVVRVANSWIPLDATESDCMYPQPSRQIQERYIFITGEKDAGYHKISRMPAALNKVEQIIVLNLDSASTSATFSYRYPHHSSYSIRRYFLRQSQEKSDMDMRAHFESQAKNSTYKNLNIVTTDDEVAISGDLHLSTGVFNTYNDQLYISTNFIPFPHDLPRKPGNDTRMLLYETWNRHCKVTILTGTPVRLAEPVQLRFDKDGFSYDFNIRQTGKKQVEIEYLLKYDDVQINPQQYPSYNELNNLITKSLNYAIILQ
jgi:transglutaminase-like putative cysteine protease